MMRLLWLNLDPFRLLALPLMVELPSTISSCFFLIFQSFYFHIAPWNLSLFLELIEPTQLAHGCWGALYKYLNIIPYHSIPYHRVWLKVPISVDGLLSMLFLQFTQLTDGWHRFILVQIESIVKSIVHPLNKIFKMTSQPIQWTSSINHWVLPIWNNPKTCLTSEYNFGK